MASAMALAIAVTWAIEAQAQGAVLNASPTGKPAVVPYKTGVTSDQAVTRSALRSQLSGLQGASRATGTNRTAGTSASSAVALPVDLALAPATTFANNCTRCHGNLGARLPAEASRLSVAKLVSTVNGMMTRRAGLKPTAAEVQAMAAYARALRGGAYASIVNGASFVAGTDATLRGEASLGAALAVLKGDQATTVTVRKGQWTLKNAPKAPFRVRVRNAARTQSFEFKFPAAQWGSHAVFAVTALDRLHGRVAVTR
jgi:hypothetical protein